MLAGNGPARMLHNVTAFARLSGGDDVIAALDNRGLAFGVITSKNQSFVLGDHPLARMGGSGHLLDAATELWLPVTPQIAVTPWGAKGTTHRFDLTTGMVRHLNQTVARNSNIIASRSPALVRSLIGLSSRSPQ